MRYNISSTKAPEMPNLGRGTECIKLLLTQASKEMREPHFPDTKITNFVAKWAI